MGNVLAASSSSHGFSSSTLIFIVVIVAAVYLLMIRPQRRKAQQAQQKQSSVQPGARVRTTAGMYATVVDVDGDDVILEVAPGVEARFMKRAIMDVVSPGDEPEAEPFSADDDETDDVDDTYDTDDSDESPESDDSADAEETAYRQATGTKKD
jgi:preprotein translocase subunit YajC